jgi:HlyD family secretion protein
MDRPLSNQARNKQKLSVWSKVSFAVMSIVLFAYTVNWFFTPSIKRSTLRTAIVSTEDLTVTINAGGLVVPMIEETITSEIASQVKQVNVEPGQNVQKGDVLLELDTQKVRLEIDNIQEKIALKDSQINSQKVTTNKALNELNSQLELLSVDLESRETRKEKLDRLRTVGAFSSQDLLEAQLNVKRTLIEIRQLEQAKLDVQSSGQAQVDTLALEKNILLKALKEQQRLEQAAFVTAPRSGSISWLNQEDGSSVIAGQALARIIDDSQYKIEATLSDFYASQLVPNMRATIRYQDQVIMGRLVQQTPTIENGVMKLSVVLDTPNIVTLKNNLRVDVGLITNKVEDSLALSKGPYVSGRGIHNVFVIRDNIAYRTQIEIGHSSTNLHEIRQGLNEGDEVIISDMSDYAHLNEFAVN